MSKTTTDPIADMLTRIRNAIAVRKHEVTMPHSNVKEAVAKILVQSGFIDGVNVSDARVGKTLTININAEGTNARITEISRMSTPGRCQYSIADKIPTVRRGRGIVVVSTSKGMMTGADAKKHGHGGELICKVY